MKKYAVRPFKINCMVYVTNFCESYMHASKKRTKTIKIYFSKNASKSYMRMLDLNHTIYFERPYKFNILPWSSKEKFPSMPYTQNPEPKSDARSPTKAITIVTRFHCGLLELLHLTHSQFLWLIWWLPEMHEEHVWNHHGSLNIEFPN